MLSLSLSLHIHITFNFVRVFASCCCCCCDVFCFAFVHIIIFMMISYEVWGYIHTHTQYDDYGDNRNWIKLFFLWLLLSICSSRLSCSVFPFFHFSDCDSCVSTIRRSLCSLLCVGFFSIHCHFAQVLYVICCGWHFPKNLSSQIVAINSPLFHSNRWEIWLKLARIVHNFNFLAATTALRVTVLSWKLLNCDALVGNSSR